MENSNLDCPVDHLNIPLPFSLDSDYYCNRGYWKCIMIKGSPVQDTGKKCQDSLGKLETTDKSMCIPIDAGGAKKFGFWEPLKIMMRKGIDETDDLKLLFKTINKYKKTE